MEERKEVPVPKESPLENHIRFFGGEVPQISYSSMREQNMKIGLSPQRARMTAALVALKGGLETHWCPFFHFKPEEAVGKLNHPHSTHIYNKDGSINEERWGQLLKYTELNEFGEKIITESKLYEFLSFCRKNENRSDFLNLGKKASDGEWAAYMDCFTEKNDAGIRFVTIENLRNFYVDSSIPGHEVEGRISKSV